MIISRTPFRISFFGGGTDYPAWTREHQGSVLGTTINKYCYLTCRWLPPFFAYRSRILYSKVEHVQTLDEIQHPAVRETLRHMGIDAGVEIHHDGDLPARTGLGSSSTFTVGLLHALHGLKGTMPSKMDLALQAIHIEQRMIRENVGMQDQVLAAHGGLNRVDFRGELPIQVSPLLIPSSRLEAFQDHLLLFFTGFTRTASEIAGDVIAQIPKRTAELTRTLELLEEALRVLQGPGDLREFGRLLDEGWRIKRTLSPRIATPAVDEIYAKARAAGAAGGKLLGAGGGGFLLLFAAPEDHPRIRAALADFLHVPFRFEFLGSQIIFFDRINVFEMRQAEPPALPKPKDGSRPPSFGYTEAGPT
jgi:D-glycero-alpha-D-manno-heptose-7-phosphate kinase